MSRPSSDISWYAISINRVFDLLNASKTGLSSSEASKRLVETGSNTFPRHQPEKIISIVFRQVKNPLVYILLGSTILALVLEKLTEAIVVFSVVLINTIIGFIQEYQAGQTIEGLLKF